MSSDTNQPGIVVCTGDDEDIVCMQSDYRVQASFLCAMQKDDKFCDVKLFGVAAASSTENTMRPIHAHKAVLAYASKHLFDLFTSENYTDSHQSEYKIENVDHESLRIIVGFLYTDQLTINESNAVNVMRGVLIGAKYLLMPLLAEVCETFLADTELINLSNCISLWCFARKYSCLTLMHAISTFIAENLHDMPGNAEFLTMPFDDCAKLLLNEALINADADLRCSAAIAWLDCDNNLSRLSHMHDILNMIPLTPGSVSVNTVLKANSCQILQKNAPDVVQQLMTGVFRRIDQNLPVIERDSYTSSSSMKSAQTWYVIGGDYCPKTFLSYDVGRRLWSKLPSLAAERESFGACAMDNRLFAIGGNKEHAPATHVDEYCFASKLWSRGRIELRRSRTRLAVCSNGLHAYAIGGGSMRNEPISLVERYNMNSNEIISLASMSMLRVFPVAVFDFRSNSIYAAGGWGYNGSLVSSIEKYDISNNKWSQAGRLSVSRHGLAAVLSGDDLYTLGGIDEKADNCVEVFNVRTSQTRLAPNLLIGRHGCKATSMNNGNVICVLGGKSPTVECYDVREGKWSTGVIVPDMPERNTYFGFATV